MHDPTFYGVEYIVFLLGTVFLHRFLFSRNRKYDGGSLYMSILAATYLWIVAVAMHLYGIELGFLAGVIGGGIAVGALDVAAGLLWQAGY